MAGTRSTTWTPFVSASRTIPEVTLQSVFLGIVLGIVLAAANTYLGLYAGMTVSASIPAAVISMGILRGLLKRGTILENNVVQTIASTGESLAAGVIFTIPALLIAGVWDEVYFLPTTLVCISGGLLGILFMIPLRKSHIVEDTSLTFPEGVACAEVLKAGETGGKGVSYLVSSMIAGAGLKLLTSGVGLLKGVVEWAGSFGSTAFYFGTDISAALVGVGYIIRFNIAVLVFLGGAIGWLIGIPILGLTEGISDKPMDWFWTAWSTKIRYVGVGAMMVGGIWSIISIWGGIKKGFAEALKGYSKATDSASQLLRTEISMKNSHIALLLTGVVVLVFVLYQTLIQSASIAAVSTVSMIVLSFFFVAVASYIVGLVGSSSSPVSGMTICAVMITAGLLILMGMTGTQGMIATLGVAGVVCCAACTSGDISQDLKTGHLLGATPRKQQWMEVIGATVPTLFIAPVVMILHKSYGIGTGEPGALKAPQASLFASLAQAFFGEGTLPWNFVFIGMGVGAAIVIADQWLKSRNSQFRMPIMAVAVGIYLPLSLSVPILIGGLLSGLFGQKKDSDPGVLFASGLIAGEALLGVGIGAYLYFNPKSGASAFAGLGGFQDLLSILALGGICFALARLAGKKEQPTT